MWAEGYKETQRRIYSVLSITGPFILFLARKGKKSRWRLQCCIPTRSWSPEAKPGPPRKITVDRVDSSWLLILREQDRMTYIFKGPTIKVNKE